MTENRHNESSEQVTADEVLAALDMLAESIDSSAYPGRAWSGALGRQSLRKFLITAATAAAAAIVLLAAAIPFLPPGPKPQTTAAASQPAGSDSVRPVQLTKWSMSLPEKVAIVPSKEHRIDVALAGKFVFKIPDIQIPSDGEAERSSWNVPKFTFSTSLKRKKDNDKQKDTRSDSGSSPGGRDDPAVACNQPGSTPPRQSRQTGQRRA